MSKALLEVIKKTALEAFTASKPTIVVFGEVINTDPLQVQVDQGETLDADFLVLTWAVSDYTLEGNTNTDGMHDHIVLDPQRTSQDSGHSHTVTVYVKNSLKKGDRVKMTRMQGGQCYIIDNKVVTT